jgi:hypothetical protein
MHDGMHDAQVPHRRNLRGRLWQLIQCHNARGLDPIEAFRVGDCVDLPLGTDDPTILDWCARNEHVLVTFDKDTMPGHWSERLQQGLQVPAIFMLRSQRQLSQIVDFLVLAAHASTPDEWKQWIKYVP